MNKEFINTILNSIIFTCRICKKRQSFPKAQENINLAKRLAKEEGWFFLSGASCCNINCYNIFCLYIT